MKNKKNFETVGKNLVKISRDKFVHPNLSRTKTIPYLWRPGCWGISALGTKLQMNTRIMKDPQNKALPGIFCTGKLTVGKNLPGKNSVPELKNGGKKICPLRVWKGKKEIRREAPKKFWLTFLVDD